MEHSGFWLAARTGDREPRNLSLRMMGTDVDSIKMYIFGRQKCQKSTVHRLQSGIIEQPTGKTALIGDDNQVSAFMLQCSKRFADTRLKNYLIWMTRIEPLFNQGAVTIEEHRAPSPSRQDRPHEQATWPAEALHR